MYKIYLRQAIQMLRQNMLMSIIAILGTALAIMMIMTTIVAEEVKNVSVAPEPNRHRTYYMTQEMQQDTVKNSNWTSPVNYTTYYDYFRDLKTPEASTAYFSIKSTLNMEGMSNKEKGTVKFTDTDYFKIVSLSLIEGRIYTEEEFASGVKYAIISESMARKLMRGENPLNKTLMIQRVPYLIIGVVKDVSKIFSVARSDIWVPYTSREKKGKYVTFLLMARDNKDYPAMYAEIRNREQQFNSNNVPNSLSILGPINNRVYSMNLTSGSEEDIEKDIETNRRKKLLIITILLLVPAINLSGLSFSRMKKRMSEIGVRKAFGAKRYIILLQVLFENLITSLIGGILGLICSYVTILQMKDWLLNISADSSVPVNALVSPMIFAIVFILCILINLLSAGIPAWRASRITITSSINQNDK